MNCPACNSQKNKKISSEFPGYVEGTSYEIFNCTKCNTQFISTKDLNKKIYNTIYAEENITGYDKYYKRAQEIKHHKNPLKFLSKEESTYYPIYQLMKKNKNKLKILEVGCGYGYTTYALNKMGHDARGIDISENAISYAKSNFGNNYSTVSIDEFNTNEKFDLIIATELIEHLKDPAEFIGRCANLLNENGKMVITTPNKDYEPKGSIWKTVPPPGPYNVV